MSGEPSGNLVDEAEQFATALRETLEGSITHSANLRIEEVIEDPHGGTEQQPVAIVEPVRSKQCVPLGTTPENEVGLFLRFSFTVRLDDERQYMAIETSQFGLCTNEETGACPIRVEYERAKESKRPAHLHIDGHSEGFGFAYGRLNRKVKPLQKMHIPLGHRRYRPSLEDFILFLGEERLLPDRHPGWEQVIEKHRSHYERRQLKAAVRRDQEATAEQLQREGWTVTRPSP